MDQAIELLQSLLRLDTQEGRSLQAASLIRDAIKEVGIAAEIDEYSPERSNLYATIKGDLDHTVALSGHLDTVPIGEKSKWAHDPLAGEIVDDHVWGRGSVDMKGGIASIVRAFLDLASSDKPTPEVRLILTTEEEINMNGARRAVEKGMMEGVEKILIAEPTSLNIGIAEKGVFWVNVTVHGKSAHGAYPHLGKNSIVEMARILPRFYEAIPSDDHELVGPSSLNIGVIRGGTKPNVVPETTFVSLDYRISPHSSLEDVDSKLKNILAEEDTRTEFSYTMEVVHRLVPLENPDIVWAEDVLNIVSEVTGEQKQITGLRYATDAAILCVREQEPVPFIIFGPGDPDLCHQTNERVPIREVIAASETIKRWILTEFSD